jgi:hypothetical protein
MQEEIDFIERNHTWELLELPYDHRTITLKWVYKLKRNEVGEIVKHKARLATCGFMQQVGIDFDEVFALVTHMDPVAPIWASSSGRVVGPPHGCKIRDLKEVCLPVVWICRRQSRREGPRLKKALYDLRQAPRAWNSKLDDTLKMNFVHSEHEHAMYRHSSGEAILLFGVYMDDLVITGSSLVAVEFKEEMKRVFLMSDLRLLSFYLSIEVLQAARGISLQQWRT